MKRPWPRACVLLYHRVAETDFDPHGLAVTPARFEAQLRWVRERCPVVTLEELLARRWAIPDRAVAVTFDDGYLDNLDVGAPIAAELGVPITIFVTSGPVESGQRFWWDEVASLVLADVSARGQLVLQLDRLEELALATPDQRRATHERLHRWLGHRPAAERERILAALRVALGPLPTDGRARPLTPTELRALAAMPRVTIGAHSLNHPALGALSAAEQRHELSASKRQLEAWLAQPVTLLAYPFGKPADVSPLTRRLARTAGYRAAFTTVEVPAAPWSDRYALPRLTVQDWSTAALEARLTAFFGGAA